jgi:uncharacterized protein YjbI with pentapeptide repeats
VTGADFGYTTSRGFTQAQLASTSSYQAKNLQGIWLWRNDLTGWDFSRQDLTGANLISSTLTNANLSGANLANSDLRVATLTDANLTGAVVTSANFSSHTSNDFTQAQLASTASYQAKNLQGIGLEQNNLTGWDFSGQDLTGANLGSSTLTNANLTGAVVTGANFGESRGFTQAQLVSTANYQAKNLHGIELWGNDLTGWDFSGQDLTSAFLGFSTLTSANLTGAVVTGANFNASRGFTQFQLASTANYQAKNLQGIGLGDNDLTGWDFSGQNLTGANLGFSTLTNANLSGANLNSAWLDSAWLTNCDLTGADLRGANVWTGEGLFVNSILPDGSIHGLIIAAPQSLSVRDDDGVPDPAPSWWLMPRDPIPITVEQEMTMAPGGVLELAFAANDWGSTIHFLQGIPVQLGGTLELTFADDVDVATQVGRTLHIFDWTSVEPTGSFTIASPYLWDLSNLYTTGEVRLTGTGGVADYDQNGLVDQGDLDLVLLNWGRELIDPMSAGWINDLPTGLIDQNELDKILLNWGRQVGAGLSTPSVPEPATIGLCVVMGCLVAWFGRRTARW